MKKLSKLVINPEKVMKNDELKTLRGGSYNPTSYICKLGSEKLACFNIPDCPDEEAARVHCQTCFGGDTIIYSCGFLYDDCIYVYDY